MTDPYDPYGPYRQNLNDPYGQPGAQGQQPYGSQYGQAPYQGQQPYRDQPQFPGDRYQDPYQGGQPNPTLQFDPYRTQQPYQGSYGQPAGWGDASGPGSGGPGGFPPPPRKKRATPTVVIGLFAVLVLLGGGVVAAIALRGGDEPAAATVAGVTTVSGAPASSQPSVTSPASATAPSATATTASAIAPSASDAEFEVGQCATLTPEGNDRATMRMTRCGGPLSDVVIAKVQADRCAVPYLSFDPGLGKVYCLAMDARENDCFKLDNLIKRAMVCADEGTKKVVKIFEGVADDSKCDSVPESVDSYAYPDPPRTLCLGMGG